MREVLEGSRSAGFLSRLHPSDVVIVPRLDDRLSTEPCIREYHAGVQWGVWSGTGTWLSLYIAANGDHPAK